MLPVGLKRSWLFDTVMSPLGALSTRMRSALKAVLLTYPSDCVASTVEAPLRFCRCTAKNAAEVTGPTWIADRLPEPPTISAKVNPAVLRVSTTPGVDRSVQAALSQFWQPTATRVRLLTAATTFINRC